MVNDCLSRFAARRNLTKSGHALSATLIVPQRAVQSGRGSSERVPRDSETRAERRLSSKNQDESWPLDKLDVWRAEIIDEGREKM